MCATVELEVKVHSDTVPAARLFTIPLYSSCFFSESFFMLWRRADALLTFSLFSSSSLFFISSTCFFFSSCWEREGRRREGRVEWRGEKGVGRGKLEGKLELIEERRGGKQISVRTRHILTFLWTEVWLADACFINCWKSITSALIDSYLVSG